MRELVLFIPSIESGGVEKNLFLLLSYLAKRIKKIHLITSNFHIKKSQLGKNINVIKPSSWWSNKNRIFKYFICSVLLLKYFLGRKIIILSFQANVFATIISLFLRAKIIIRLNTSPDKYINNFFKKKFFKLFYSFADEIIVNSYLFKKILKKDFKLSSKCIYNSIILEKRTKKKINFFHKFNGLKILSIGRLTSQKDQITILKSANLLKDQGINFKIFIIGQGHKYKSLSDYIYKNELKKYVKLGGYKNSAQDYLSDADLFILSSRYEGLPNVLIEAQNLNIPIISSNCNTGPSEILKNGKLGDLFKVGDFYSLYLKIKRFKKNKINLKNKSKLAKKYFYRFDYYINSKKYFDMIKKFNQ